MTLSPDIKHIIASHTANMHPLERRIRVKSLCRKYRIENEEDLREAATIAGIKFEEMN